TFSAQDGSYTIDGLPSGTYVVTVVTNCCTYAAYTSDELAIDRAQSVELNIRLEEGFTLSVVGDDPGLKNDELRARQSIPDQAVPHMADGRPDLSGVWLPSDDPFPEPARALPWAAEISRERVANQLRDLPGMRCLPNSVPPFYAGASRMSKFVQTPDLLIVLFEESPGFRQVFLDGRDHPESPNPGWVGHSIGRWEGDVLVVDTVGFNARGWAFTYPRTEMLHIEERYERIDFGQMRVRVTIEDPGVFSEPLIRNMTWDLAPQEEILEYVCENNKWADAVTEGGTD
ncbi:MAG TPA: carboxypeptidase-like regulatory domain-containing protein, partial [Gammaproteobacteria bacterium]|nr:carboxypeptidase-like regulatory domain-containing protein [Gammaproteobacteria bacterium]